MRTMEKNHFLLYNYLIFEDKRIYSLFCLLIIEDFEVKNNI